ncbi:MAG TPA: transglutaminase-like domain-containing protein [Thermoanaerobaculia bacterium]|nr:transglutaminase-like domain-containing protein [Thermoanaerobaculia bacterium]
MRRASKLIATCLVAGLTAFPGFAAATRTVDATMTATMTNIPEGAAKIKVWVPLPRSTAAQTIEAVEIISPYRWVRHSEPEFGNEYLFAEIDRPADGQELLALSFRATRREITAATLEASVPSRRELRRNLRADRLASLSPRIRKLAADITAGKTGRVEQAKAIYDYILLTMKYDKTNPGWGLGDAERACEIGTGNCTDFHSLFTSLARARGIPARFVMGFPIPEGGTASSYHCWAEYYVRGRGWIPVDPSEASKSSDPARRAYLFGNLDPDRIELTRGRDLELTPRTSEPLNYFIYPRLEVDGEEAGTSAVSVVFRDVPDQSDDGQTGTR